jgi:hypothetical protein
MGGAKRYQRVRFTVSRHLYPTSSYGDDFGPGEAFPRRKPGWLPHIAISPMPRAADAAHNSAVNDGEAARNQSTSP